MEARKYDLDWLRVIAIGLLIIYHTAIAFQPWGLMIGFITNKQPLEAIWKPMMMLNIWRIPLLFFISGMGVYFSFQSRDGRQLIYERARRILLPFIFGSIVLVPGYMLILQKYYGWNLQYTPSPGHLWFLGNIFLYVLLTLPFMMLLKKNKSMTEKISKIFGSPLSLIGMIALMVVEAYLFKPAIYEMYAMTWHGFALGLFGFIFGYLMAMQRSIFDILARYKWMLLLLAMALFMIRMTQFIKLPGNIVFPTESMLWIFSIFGLGYTYLNFSSKRLTYLSNAAYPVYSLHMLFIGLASFVIFPLSLNVITKYFLVVIITLLFSFMTYEILIKRINLLRMLFGLKRK
jgi:glucans biosynthesis protein C